ncbi:MAG: hypothetical protein ACREM3_13860 [Candidatus Rokuibacteriota bacterium]
MPRDRVRPSPKPTMLLLAFLVAAGCAALPDVSPFATASRELAGAVKASGAAVTEDLQTSPSLDAEAKKFDRAWAARNDAMRAVVSYSDGLVGIVEATGDARASARSLADKLGGLAAAAGVAQPGAGAAANVAADTAAFIWAQVALARGAASLEQALGHAQPAIDRLAEIMSRDTDDLLKIVRGLSVAQRTTLTEAFNEAFGYRKTLAQRRSTLRDKGFGNLTTADLGELQRIDELMTPVNAELQKYDEQSARIDRRERANLRLVAATRDALERWATAHREVALALQNRRPVSVESLNGAAVELRTLVTRIREL